MHAFFDTFKFMNWCNNAQKNVKGELTASGYIGFTLEYMQI